MFDIHGKISLTIGPPFFLLPLDLLRGQTSALVDAEIAVNLLHGLCVSVLHGGPSSPGTVSLYVRLPQLLHFQLAIFQV